MPGGKRKKNLGYSIVELIVVLAIMVVVGGGVALGIRVAVNQYTNSCAKNLKSIIETTRTLALGRQNACLKLENTENGLMAQMFVQESSGWVEYGDVKKIGNSSVDVYYSVSSDPPSVLLDGTLYLVFSRNSGRMLVSSVPEEEERSSSLVTYFRVTRGADSDRIKTVKLEVLTGKVTVLDGDIAIE